MVLVQIPGIANRLISKAINTIDSNSIITLNPLAVPVAMSDKRVIAGGGSRAAKKRRKESATKSDQGPTDDVKKSNSGQEESLISKKSKFSADTLSRISLELVEASAAITSSSSSGMSKKLHCDLLKLSVKEVMALEDVVEVDCPSRAAAVLSILLSPFERSTFYSDYWEKRPMHSSNDSDKNKCVKGLLSSKQFRQIIKSHSILYGLDVTTSQIKTRYDTKSPDGDEEDEEEEVLIEAKESELWEHYKGGYSIRLLCPQKFHDPLWSLLSVLEFEFGTRVGCCVDLIPPNGQGFKPRYDNYDSLVVQLEGCSKWKVYSPLEGFELPRSPSFEIELSQLPAVVSFEAVLKPGECMYIPKGWTRRQENFSPESSMFLSIQMNEGNCMADLLEIVMPEALAEAVEKKTDLRRSLPRSFHSFMGVASSENDEDPLR